MLSRKVNRSKRSRTDSGNTGSESVTVAEVIKAVEEKMKKKQPSPARHWCFTINNPTPEDFKLIEERLVLTDPYVGGLVAQTEVGDETGTRHIQGYVRFKTKRRWTCLKWSKKIHWEVCRSVDKAIDYCRKEDTWDGEWRVEHGVTGKIEDPFEGRPPLPWQQKVIDICKTKPDRRTIHWFWSEEGNVGKTSLGMWLYDNLGAYVAQGRVQDATYEMGQMQLAGMALPKIVVMDIPRVVEHISYTALELIKNGMFKATKFKPVTVRMPSPHVIVFANRPPDLSAMSADRWSVVDIGEPRSPFRASSGLIAGPSETAAGPEAST